MLTLLLPPWGPNKVSCFVSMCVSLTLHFQMSGKRPLLGPRRGPPFCNTSTTNQSFLDGGLHSGSFHHSLQALMDATKIKPTVLSWQSSSAGYTHDSALCTSKILLCRCSATLGAENRACVPSLSVRPDSLRPHGVYVAHQASLFMEFSRQEHWNGLPCPPPGDPPSPGIDPHLFLSATLADGFFTTSATWEAC